MNEFLFKSKHTNFNSVTYIRLCLEMYSCFVKSHYHSIYINGHFLLFLFEDEYVPFFYFCTYHSQFVLFYGFMLILTEFAKCFLKNHTCTCRALVILVFKN